MFDFDVVIDLLRSDGSVVVNKNLARNIGLDCAVLYSELASKYKYFKSRGQLTEDGFFFNTVDNLCYDTCLSDYQQREGIEKLIKLGLVDKCVKGLPAKRYFKVVPNVEILQKYLQHQDIQQFLSNLKTRNKLSKKLDVKKVDGNNTKPNNPKSNNNKKNKASSLRNDGMNFVDNFSEDARLVFDYFISSYVVHKKESHPTINKKVADKLNSIMEYEEIYDPDTDRNLTIDLDVMYAMIDLYFTETYNLNNGGQADHRIYHFISDMVLKNLYYKAVY